MQFDSGSIPSLDCYMASPSQIRTYIEESLDTEKKADDDRLRHSIDATAAELTEASADFQAALLKGPISGRR